MVGTSSRVREAAAAMPPTEPFHLGGFLHQWYGKARHDLTPSHSRSLAMADLLALATPEERARWDGVQLDYASPRGASALRTLIAARYHGLGEDDVVCCAGAQESMACVARALLAEGDHAIVVIPLYQPLAWAVTDRVHATGVPMEDTLDIRRVAAAIRPQTRMVLINTPNSPTGATVDVATQADLVELCRQHGLWLVNDEVYRESVADPALLPPPIAVAYERGVSIGALSKAFGLPGLRVGWVASQDTALLAQVATAKSALSSCLAAPAEGRAQVALREEARPTAWRWMRGWRATPLCSSRTRRAAWHSLSRPTGVPRAQMPSPPGSSRPREHWCCPQGSGAPRSAPCPVAGYASAWASRTWRPGSPPLTTSWQASNSAHAVLTLAPGHRPPVRSRPARRVRVRPSGHTGPRTAGKRCALQSRQSRGERRRPLGTRLASVLPSAAHLPSCQAASPA